MSRKHDPRTIRRFSRLHIERLEPRLPPGDALLGLLLAWPDLASPMTSELDRQAISLFASADKTPPVVTHRREATPETHGDIPIAKERTSHSADQRAAGLIPAVRPSVLNRAAQHTSAFDSHSAATLSSIDQRAAGLIPAVRNVTIAHPAAGAVPAALMAGINPAARPESSTPDAYGNLPLTFEANHGQTDAGVDFIARTGAGTMFVTPTAAVFSITQSASVDASARRDLPTHGGLTQRRSPGATGAAIHMQILDANPDAQPTGINRQPGIVNYFIGNDPNQWHANIPTFGGVQYDDVYPGIDLVYYGNNGQLEYDFIVSPGADPSAISLNFAGADGVEVNSHGDLVLHTAAGDIVQQKPITYQEIGNARRTQSHS